VRPKADGQLNLPQGTKKTERVIKRIKNKNRDAQKKWSGHEVRGVSPDAGKERWERFVKEVSFKLGVNE